MHILRHKYLISDHGIVLTLCILYLFPATLTGQAEKKFIRQGNREYEKEKFAESEISYRRALDKNKAFPDAVFNIGDALYKQEKYDDAVRQFEGSSAMTDNPDKKSEAFYNQGNSLLMGGKLQESIEAYKNSLRLKPGNLEAKYNLAFAQDLLRKQEEQKNQDKNKQDNREQNQERQNNQDKENNDKDQEKQQEQNNQQQQQQQSSNNNNNNNNSSSRSNRGFQGRMLNVC